MKIERFINKINKSAQEYPKDIFSNKNKIYTCVNPFSYHLVRKDFDLFNSMDGIFVDGVTMCWWVKLLWKKSIPRLSFDMTGMAKDLFSFLNKNNDRTIYFIGAKQNEIEQSIKNIKVSFSNISIAGFRNGYFLSKEDRLNSIQEIIKINPDYIVVGMGSPLQEKYLRDLKHQGFTGIGFTCGGFLHQTTNSINYYPRWVNKWNLRAFYRLFHEKGLFKRLYNVLIEFPSLFLYDSINSKLIK